MEKNQNKIAEMQNTEVSTYNPNNLQNPIAQRLAEYIAYKQMSIRSFERSIDVRQGWLHSMRASIRPDKLELILNKYPDINVRWLYTGAGQMLENAVQHATAPDGAAVCMVQVNAYEEVRKLTSSVQSLTQENLMLQKTVEKLTDALHTVLTDGRK